MLVYFDETPVTLVTENRGIKTKRLNDIHGTPCQFYAEPTRIFHNPIKTRIGKQPNINCKFFMKVVKDSRDKDLGKRTYLINN